MKEIQLTQGKVALVDDEDFERLNQYKWYTLKARSTFHATRNGNNKTLERMHRTILNAPEGVQVDHRNGNCLDNQKHNLRLCTQQQNMHNKKQPHKNNKIGIKGVCWHKASKKFRATIRINGKVIHLGLYNVMGDADSAYRIAEEKHFGEFARAI